MSAYVVSDRTINALLAFAVAHRVSDFNDPAAAGNILLAENQRSVNYLYGEHTPAPVLKYDAGEPVPELVQVLKLIDCVEYQSCETPDWVTTPAFQLLNHLRSKATGLLPGYDAAEWGLH